MVSFALCNKFANSNEIVHFLPNRSFTNVSKKVDYGLTSIYTSVFSYILCNHWFINRS